jgi:hypothetical protein
MSPSRSVSARANSVAGVKLSQVCAYSAPTCMTSRSGRTCVDGSPDPQGTVTGATPRPASGLWAAKGLSPQADGRIQAVNATEAV